MSCTTLSFLITTPEAWVPALGDANHGFPYLSGAGRLIVKDCIMLRRSSGDVGGLCEDGIAQKWALAPLDTAMPKTALLMDRIWNPIQRKVHSSRH